MVICSAISAVCEGVPPQPLLPGKADDGDGEMSGLNRLIVSICIKPAPCGGGPGSVIFKPSPYSTVAFYKANWK